MAKLGALRVAGSKWLGRLELLTECLDFGSDTFRTAVCIFRQTPFRVGRCATGIGKSAPIERVGVVDAARPDKGAHGGAMTPPVYRGLNLCSKCGVMTP